MHTKTNTKTERQQTMGDRRTIIQQQQQNHHLRTDNSLSHQGAKMHFTGGLNAFYWRQTFAIESVVVKNKNC